MNDKERFALAERVLKKVQEKHLLFPLLKRRDEIEKELRAKNEYRGS